MSHGGLLAELKHPGEVKHHLCQGRTLENIAGMVGHVSVRRRDARWRQNARPAGAHVSWGAMRPALLAAATVFWVWTVGAAAQDINPDRPDLTTSAEVVPPGALQIETGLEYERARVGGGPAERQLSVQGVLRLGLTPALEISLEGEPFVWLRAAEDDHGSGDYTLGLKYRFLAPSPDAAAPRWRSSRS